MLLQECESSLEVTGIRSVLEAHGIACLTKGENQSQVLGLGSAIIVAKSVLVAEEDLEEARALLSSRAIEETTGAPLEGGLCPVHEKQAIASCGRCGSFVCASCKSPGAPPICESCLEAERRPPPAAPSSAQPKLFFVVLAIVVVLVLTRRLWLG